MEQALLNTKEQKALKATRSAYSLYNRGLMVNIENAET
jgi:hypothetical protein